MVDIDTGSPDLLPEKADSDPQLAPKHPLVERTG